MKIHPVRLLLFTAGLVLVAARLSGASLDAWHWRSPLPQGNHLNAIAYGSGAFVAVGDYGTILRSTDGANWGVRSLETTNDLTAITYGNGRFVAVGQLYSQYPNAPINIAVTSADGLNWSTHYLDASGLNLLAVAYGNGTFVAVGRPYNYYPVTNGIILTSTDAVTWTHRSLIWSNSLYAITFGNGRFVAVGDWAAGPAILTSEDGANWTARDAFTAGYLNSVAYGNGRFVAAGGTYGTPLGVALFSTDGATWTPSTFTASSNSYFNALAYGNGGFVVLGEEYDFSNGIYSRDTSVLTSPDGANWMRRGVGTTSNLSLFALAYGNGTFAAAGSHGDIASSVDGVNRIPRCAATDNNLRSVKFNNSTFVAVGNNGTNLVSFDGLTWAGHWTGTSNGLHEVAWGNGSFVAVGAAGTILTSPNGSAWSPVNSGTNLALFGVAYGGGVFVTVGGDCNSCPGVIRTSPDGVTWTDHSPPFLYRLHGVTYGNGLFVAVGAWRILNSTDGVNWTNGILPSYQYFKSVTYGNGIFVAVGESGQVILSSTNGLTWTAHDSGVSVQFDEVRFGNGIFVAVGQNGSILESVVLPFFATQPQSRLVCAADPVSFTVDVAASCPIGLQWQHNGTNIPGALDSTYTIASATPDDAGTYTAVVSDGEHSVLIATAALQVNVCRALDHWTKRTVALDFNALNGII